ncbi:MAG TPA: hypothetical protein VLB84_20040 [Bacteroidia bacterium]|nr:hypothetical protein [Bacteroidia bacterium]
MDVVYDIETYKNVFTLSAVFTNGSGMRTFEISDRKNECEQLLDFLRNVNKHKMKMVGTREKGEQYFKAVTEKVAQFFVEVAKTKSEDFYM